MYTYIHIDIVYSHTYIQMYVSVYVCMYMYACICMYVCMYVCVYVYVCVFIYVYVCMHNILGGIVRGNVLPKTGGGIARGNCPGGELSRGNCPTPKSAICKHSEIFFNRLSLKINIRRLT